MRNEEFLHFNYHNKRTGMIPVLRCVYLLFEIT